jgi:hypothetical protein
VDGLTLATNTTAPIRHRLSDFFKEPFRTPVVSDPTARQLRGDGAALPQARPVRTSSWTRSIAKILTSGAGRRTARGVRATSAGGVAARKAINARQTIRPRPKPVRLTAPLTPHLAAPQQSAALADHAARPAVRKAHGVYAARIAAVDQPLPPGN